MALCSRLLFAAGLLCVATAALPDAAPGYQVEILPGQSYDPAIPRPEACLGFALAERPAPPADIEACVKAWAEASARVEAVQYATTHEGRPLYYVVVSRPERMDRLEEIKAKLAQLSHPGDLTTAQAKALLADVPGVAWMAYSIHGNETSGSDAALGLIYHLAAGTGDRVSRVLDKLIVIVDPMMNPDGRHRALAQSAEYSGEVANYDDQSLAHTGYWPWGRGNHYFADLNRDWLFGVHPETRGRMRAVNAWQPLLFVDAHEMGPQDSYLFSPPRDPKNPNFPARSRDWNQLFAQNQAGAFDRHNWRYYSGEWNENWYPGYSDAWAAMGGAVGILYEQAGVAPDGVKRLGGRVLTYKEAVHHQLVSSLSNLRTLMRNVETIQQDYLKLKLRAVNGEFPGAERVFAVMPTANRGRLAEFLRLMELHGIKVYRLEQEITADSARDFFGREESVVLPAGTLLIPNRQAQAYRVSAVLEFETRLPAKTLAKQREAILREGATRLYDITGWNLFMLFGLEAYVLDNGLPEGVEPVTGLVSPRAPARVKEPVAWFFDGRDDRSLIAAAALLQAGVNARLARKNTRLGDVAVPEGSVVVLATDNENRLKQLNEMLQKAAQASGLQFQALATGLGSGDLADLGGGFFPLLVPPRVALLARGGISPYSFGMLWHLLDERLHLQHSHLNITAVNRTDLRRYNVIVLPDSWFGELDPALLSALGAWVKGGGTLIAVGNSAAALAADADGWVETRLLPAALKDPIPYRIAVTRQWQAAQGEPPPADRVWNHQPPLQLTYPWKAAEKADAGEDTEAIEDPVTLKPEQREQRDRWRALFMPQGAIVAARVDSKSWLTLGAETPLPVLVRDIPILMAKGPVEAPVRFGVYRPGESETARPLNWSLVPPGYDPLLRMNGLLWPEAAHRIMNGAYLTRAGVGKGQVILFAAPPNFRGASRATARLMANAILYGPSLGANAPIRLIAD